MLAKSFSIGFNSGAYGGKNNKLAPEPRINAAVSEPLWKEALSIITTWVSSSIGTEAPVGISPVRLGMQIAFGRVRRKTEPTGPGV